MPAWNELTDELEFLKSNEEKVKWLKENPRKWIDKVSNICDNRNVIFYGSAFLNKPTAPQIDLQITNEEINGFMTVLHGMDWDKNLTLILHTPGGITNAAETIVSYLHSKFKNIEVIIPTFAMSAGTMISLSSNKIIMGRQSQLGPIDPQMPVNGRFVSAGSIVEQFETAKEEISIDNKKAHLWAPILQSLGPALLQESQNALSYGESMVAKWLENRMLSNEKDAEEKSKEISQYFNETSKHKSHGRRIDRDEARKQGVVIEDLEENSALQEAVLTLYHLITIMFEKTPATKIIMSNHNKMWVKNLQQIVVPNGMPVVSQPPRK